MTYVKDLATGTLASGIGTSDSSITVNVGYGTPEEILGVWPNVPFFITVLPSSPAAKISNSLDSEVMLVTAISENAGSVTMTVTRAQRGTSAKVFNADDIVANAVYAEDAVMIGPDGAVDNPSPWIEGNDIKAGVVNAATKTANNITPSADTPADWATTLGGDGYFWTYYSSNCFANQPDQYGQLETLITGSQIYQRWHGHASGSEYYRGGNGTGWWGSSSAAGTFKMIDDNTYSTSETLCGTWIDGSPIYKKTCSVGQLPDTSTDKNVAHGISNLGAIVKVEAFARRSSGAKQFYPLPYGDRDGSTYSIGIVVNATGISVSVGKDRSALDECYVTVYYTKSS